MIHILSLRHAQEAEELRLSNPCGCRLELRQQAPRVWRFVSEQQQRLSAPAVLYRELAPEHDALRSHFSSDIDGLWIDDAAVCEQVRGIIAQLSPGREAHIRLHREKGSLFAAFGLPEETPPLAAD